MYSLALTFTSMASSIGIAMQNATTNQRSGQLIANASLVLSCKLILGTAK
jgi:hypothetical protein